MYFHSLVLVTRVLGNNEIASNGKELGVQESIWLSIIESQDRKSDDSR